MIAVGCVRLCFGLYCVVTAHARAQRPRAPRSRWDGLWWQRGKAPKAISPCSTNSFLRSNVDLVPIKCRLKQNVILGGIIVLMHRNFNSKTEQRAPHKRQFCSGSGRRAPLLFQAASSPSVNTQVSLIRVCKQARANSRNPERPALT